jgi:hypothetical protein
VTASEKIDHRIAELADWRGSVLAKVRALVFEADPHAVEEWKWNAPTWSHDGLLLAVGIFKKHVGVNFFQGASLEDPSGLFNGGLNAKNTRSIKFEEGDELDEVAFEELARAAVARNAAT